MNAYSTFELNGQDLEEVNGGILPLVAVFASGLTIGYTVGLLTK